MKYVCGLDLSLRAAGLCLLPHDWASGMDWRRAVVRTVGRSLPTSATPREQTVRIEGMARAIREFLRHIDVSEVWIEDYAFSKGSSRAHALGELGGIVKVEFLRAGIPFDVVRANTARANLGKFPTRAKKGEDKLPPVKARVHQVVKSFGAPADWTSDEVDAFVVANHGLVISGHDGLILQGAA